MEKVDPSRVSSSFGGGKEGYYLADTRAAAYKETAPSNRRLCDVRFGWTLAIAIKDIVNRSDLYDAAFLHKDRPIAH